MPTAARAAPATGDFLFGSEIKSFLDHPHFTKAVNKRALRPYLTLQFPATDETFFAGVYKLPAAHCFTYDLVTRELSVRRYWDADFSDDDSKTFDEYVDACDAVVHESVQAHRIADVKVGSFLSGGVDSSYIAACLMPDTTFSVGFDYKGLQRDQLRRRALRQAGHQERAQDDHGDEFFGVLPDIQYHMDEPQSNLSSVPLWFLAELAAKDVTVVLSGEGADELFAATRGTRMFPRSHATSAGYRAPSAAPSGASWRTSPTSMGATSCSRAPRCPRSGSWARRSCTVRTRRTRCSNPLTRTVPTRSSCASRSMIACRTSVPFPSSSIST